MSTAQRIATFLILTMAGACSSGGGGTASPPTGGSAAPTGGAGGGGPGPTGGTSGGDGSDAAAPPAMSGPYFPVKVGNSWTYQVTLTGSTMPPSFKMVTIEAMEPVGGTGPNSTKVAFRHNTCKSALTIDGCKMASSATNKLDKTLGWWGVVTGPTGNTGVNYREQGFKPSNLVTPVDETTWDPYRLRIDEVAAHVVNGAKYAETFREIKQAANGGPMSSTMQTINWVVDGVDQVVTVMPPSGAAKVYSGCLKVSHSLGTSGAKSFWYCRGIGKVKEVGTQTEELVDYKLAP
jgi:hypothetical protein